MTADFTGPSHRYTPEEWARACFGTNGSEAAERQDAIFSLTRPKDELRELTRDERQALKAFVRGELPPKLAAYARGEKA